MTSVQPPLQPLLHRAAVTTLVLSGLSAAGAYWATLPDSDPVVLKLPLLASFGFLFVIALMIASQFTQLTRRLYPHRLAGDEMNALTLKELRQLLASAPRMYRAVGLMGVLLLLGKLVLLGGVSWTTGSPFERRRAFGIGLYLCALYSIASPVLTAFARVRTRM
jgi:hypothetical protein